MFDLDAMATFVAVVRSGNFTGAATSMHLPRSTVSQRVARMETALGVRLLERTTRAVRPTDAGATYFERCTRILSDVETANDAVKVLTSDPRGQLRVATPHLFGKAVLAEVACKFSSRYPEVEIEIVVVDGKVNLIEDGFDVAIAVAASTADSTLICRTVGRVALWCCAAPSYLDARGTPSTPPELSGHECIINRQTTAMEANGLWWMLERGDEVQRIDVRGRLTLNSETIAHTAALAGAGIAALPSVTCADDLRAGRLVHVLRQWSVDPKEIRVVYPSNRYLPSRVRLFVDTLMTECKGLIPQCEGARRPAKGRAPSARPGAAGVSLDGPRMPA